MQAYLGIDGFDGNVMVSRTIGGDNSKEFVGGGFMHKPGRYEDEVNRSYGFYVIVYVIRGSGVYVGGDGVRHPIHAGSVFQRFPNVVHSNYVDPHSDWAELYLSFGPETYHALRTMRILRDDRCVYSIEPDPSLEPRIHNFIMDLRVAEESRLPDLLLSGLGFLTELMHRCNASVEGVDAGRIVNQACRFFGENYGSRIDLRDYCRRHGWGYERFRKLFKEKVGISPGRYVVRRRMEVACQLLLNGRRSIADIAEELGYTTPFEFSAHFKRHVGLSPRAYRRS